MRCDRDLAVILVNYPYFRGEPYFDAELKVLSLKFRRVFLLSRHEGDTAQASYRFELPDNVTVLNVPVPLSRWSRFLSVLGTLASGRIVEVWRDISAGAGGRNLLKFKTAVGYADFARRFMPGALGALRRNEADPRSIIWYAYWSDESAFAIAKSRSDGVIGKAFARAHGFDVYESRHPHAYLPFRRFIVSNLSGIACISSHGSKHLNARDSADAGAIYVHRLGVADRARTSAGSRHSFRILTLSNIIPIKNLEAIITALRHWEGGHLEWHHLGDGPLHEYVERVKSMVDTFSGERVSVRFHGFIKPSLVMDVIGSIRPHLLLNTSHFEGIPVSMMEAASIGLPIIGPNVCGVPEIVLHGENGFLIDPNSPEDIRDRLLQMATMTDEQYEAMCVRSQQIQRERFNAERNYRAFAEFLAGAD